jgi:hypothetical protein
MNQILVLKLFWKSGLNPFNKMKTLFLLSLVFDLHPDLAF